MARVLRGDLLAADLCRTVAEGVLRMQGEHGVTPGLAVVLVGQDPASQVYVARKMAKATEIGIRSFEHRLPEDTQEGQLLELIIQLNADPAVHGILVQLPLPSRFRADKVLNAIDPAKDVDGFHPVNVGRLSVGAAGLIPCTPLGCLMLLDEVIQHFRGLKAVVIGKSNIVGKPVALLLLERECTVEVTHIHTRNLPEIVRTADIVVVAAGSPRLVRGDWVKPGAVVIDVGINRITAPDGRSRIVGDVAADEMGHAGVVTPVPGGVGPMTVACLLSNTLRAAQMAHGEGECRQDELSSRRRSKVAAD